MYEAKQERSKQARVIDNNNKVNNPYIYINQMMSKKNNDNTYSDDYKDCISLIDVLFAYLCRAMDNLLNLNPYATYAWHRTTGCTPAEISGKREIPTILHDVSEENFKEEMKKFLDPLSLESQTFCDIDGFANYLCAFFPHIDRQIIEDVLSNMPRQTISISEEEIRNYFKDMINGNYSYSHKEIATISIIQHVNMELFVEEICKTAYEKEICELLFTVLSEVYSSYESKTNELIGHLAKVENKDFQANLTEILSDEFIEIWRLSYNAKN